MISRLEGILFEKRPTVIGVDVGGVGYEVNIPLSTFTALPEQGDLLSLHIHTQVRDDAIQLYGFSSIAEVRAFQLLIRANRGA
jgi:Holliday junction DNA helicase RuvA